MTRSEITRVLFVSAASIGHSFPLVSLAWAVCVAGHEVSYVTTEPALAVEHAGLQVIDAAPQFDANLSAADPSAVP